MTAEHSVIRGLLGRVDEIHDDVRTLSHQLHSSTLQYLGLVVALKGLCRETARQHHIVINFQSNDTDGIPQEVSLCGFRVTQEALNNAVTHGQADQIGVRLQRKEDLLRIYISDTGIGFDAGVSSDGLGLISMRERLRMLGGRLIVNSQPGKGTDITAEVPIKAA
jgi:signal transduction histidine kinase